MSLGTSATFDLGRTLRLRLNEANEQRERTQAKINQLSDQLQRMFSRAPKKPRETQEQMDSKIEKLEYQRTTSSLSLSAEKQLLRQIDGIKKSKKVLEEYHIHEHAIQEKKNEISLLRDSQRTISAAIAELESALSKVELAKRLGCTTAELQTRVVDCPGDKIGHIIGKNGSSLKQLEQRTGVQIDVDKVGSKIHLQGSVSALEAAVREVEQITLAVEEEIKMTPAVVSYFLNQKMAVLNTLQTAHPYVHIDLSRTTHMVSLRGRPEYIAAVKKDIEALNIQTINRQVAAKEIGLVVGKGGSTVNNLVAKHNVFVNVVNEKNNDENALVEITGAVPNIEAALAEVENILYENEEIDNFVMVNPMQRNMFLANAGAAIKEMQSEISSAGGSNKGGTSALLLFEKRDKDSRGNMSSKEPSKLCVRTSRFNMENALEIIQRTIAEHQATIISVEVDPDMVPAIIGKGGATINSLRQEGSGTGAEIEIDKNINHNGKCTIRIQANSSDVRENVKQAISLIIAKNQVLNVAVERPMIGLIFGEAGKEIKKQITEEMGVWMGVDTSDEHIILRGTVEKIEEAAGVLNEFMADNYMEELEINPEEESVLFRSGEDSILSRVGSDHSVTALYRKSTNKVVVRGRKDNVIAAMKIVDQFMHGGDGFSLCKIKVPESALGFVIGKGGSHIAKLEKDFEGVSVDLLRGSNYLSVRGPEESVKKCRSHVISVVATAKVSTIIPIDDAQHSILEKSETMKKINDGLSVQITLNDNSVKIRGLSSDVRDAQSRLTEQITGTFSAYIELEATQFSKVKKAFKDPTHLMRIHDTTKASVTLDTASSSVLITGKRSAVKKAKNQLYGVLDFLMPSEIVRIKLTKPLMKFLNDAEYLANVTAETGAYTALDRDLTCIAVRSENTDEVKQAVELVKERIAEYEKLNYVIKFETQDSWLLPKIIGRNGTTVNAMQMESGCSFDIYRDDLTVVVTAETTEAVTKGKEVLLKVIDQARKQCVFIEIPSGGMSAFIGRNGSNVKQFIDTYNVEIERMRKDSSSSKVRIQGEEAGVQQANIAIMKWIKEWQFRNIGITITIAKHIIPHITGAQRYVITAIMNETGANIDLDTQSSSIIIRGTEAQVQNAKDHINKMIDTLEDSIAKEKEEAKKKKMIQQQQTKISSEPKSTLVPAAKVVTKNDEMKANEVAVVENTPSVDTNESITETEISDESSKSASRDEDSNKLNGAVKVPSPKAEKAPPVAQVTQITTEKSNSKETMTRPTGGMDLLAMLVSNKASVPSNVTTTNSAKTSFSSSSQQSKKGKNGSAALSLLMDNTNNNIGDGSNEDAPQTSKTQKFKSSSGFTVRV